MKDTVYEILRELSGLSSIDANDSLQEDLGLDSLCMVTLLIQLEDALHIELDETDMNPMDLIRVCDVEALANKYERMKCNEKQS